MKFITVRFAAATAVLLASWSLTGQTLAPSPTTTPQADLEAISKKLDEQNAKIDLLSQEILKLEQRLGSTRPGIMIGEGTPSAPATSTSTAPAITETAHPQGGDSHVVARGETLTSIAKMYNLTASELQKYNHIENDRKLQIGQTIMIPGGASPAPSVSPSPATE